MPRSLTASTVVLGAAAGLSLGLACRFTDVNDDHCVNNDGDAQCARLYGTDRPFCVRADCGHNEQGCAPQRPDDDACYSPCGRGLSLDEDPECTFPAGTGSTGGMDTGSGSGSDTDATTTFPATATDTGTGDTGPQPCLTDDVCDDPDAPACGAAGVCVPCDESVNPDAACASLEAGTDVCDAGSCVQCSPANPEACTGLTPVCLDNLCTACIDHADCSDSACDLFTGACLPDNVIHVDGDGGQDALTIAAGLTMLGGGDGVLVVHQAATNYDESISITNGSTIAILAAPGESPGWVQTNTANPTLSASAGTTVLLADLELSSGNDVGISLSSANAFLQRSRIVDNAGGGISANAGSDVRVENCFVGGDNNVDAADIQSSEAEILYSTVVGNFGSSVGLNCNGAATVNVRNSIVVGRSDDYTCGATFQTSATHDEVGPYDEDWFALDAGDLSLLAQGQTTFANLATWQTGDPLTDIDGDPRIAVDGQTEHAGADVP